jgi:hypothetical protein
MPAAITVVPLAIPAANAPPKCGRIRSSDRCPGQTGPRRRQLRLEIPRIVAPFIANARFSTQRQGTLRIGSALEGAPSGCSPPNVFWWPLVPFQASPILKMVTPHRPKRSRHLGSHSIEFVFTRWLLGELFGRPPKIARHGMSGICKRSSLRACYQDCYHFLQKAARNSMNQGPTRRSMSLKYKEQPETRRNINQTHNPKVEGSNPSPATTPLNNHSTLSCSDCAAASGVYTLFETEDSHSISLSIDGSAAQFARIPAYASPSNCRSRSPATTRLH